MRTHPFTRDNQAEHHEVNFNTRKNPKAGKYTTFQTISHHIN